MRGGFIEPFTPGRPAEQDFRVSDRTRTGDHLDHNQELYQLSYAHRALSI